ncbi:MAG: hypothetical protein PVS2B1_23230 [Candidatus Dormibacteraceae bacterium]
MAAEALVRCRVSSETKALLQIIAAREDVTESALVRQLLDTHKVYIGEADNREKHADVQQALDSAPENRQG